MIYDEANKRTAQEEVVDARTPGAKFYLILNFFDDHTQYKIDTTDRKCYKGTIPDNEQWRPFGVPTGATFVQQVRNNSVDWCTLLLRGFFFIVPPRCYRSLRLETVEGKAHVTFVADFICGRDKQHH